MTRALSTSALAVAALALWALPTPEPALAGLATYMNPGIMAKVVSNKSLDLTGYTGAVALNRAGDLGRRVWLRWADGTLEGPYLVADCAQRGTHYIDRETLGRVVEVSYTVANRRGFAGVGPVPVIVYFHHPPPDRRR